MGLIREPDGVDFVICSRPLTPEGAAEITAFIQQSRERRSKELRELLEAFSLSLTPADRAELAHRLIDSLTTPIASSSPKATPSANPVRAALTPKKSQTTRRKATPTRR